MLKAINIKWDTDGDKEVFNELPTEMIVPDELEEMYKKDREYALEEISDWLSEKIGFCHDGFEIANELTYECSVNKEKILEAIKNRKHFEIWGTAQYGRDAQIIDYNIYIDNTTKNCSAFYRRIYKKEVYEEYWESDFDDCYSYAIDFSDDNWEEKLKEAAIKAYKILWGE